MKLLRTLSLWCLIFLLSCTTININHTPPKSDFVDPRAVKLVSEYKELAAIMNIKFGSNVGISFVRIEEPNVIGLCYYAFGYRQIEIDAPFWDYSDSNTRAALLFHELTHCYCTRKHDYKGGAYPESKEEKDQEWEYMTKHGGDRPGYYPDGCPTSLMAPIVVDTSCFQAHYGHYIEEMFDRCDPY